MNNQINVLDHGFVKLLNLSGPVRRVEGTISLQEDNDYLLNYREFDADDTDPALTARISFNNFDKERSREQDLRLVEYLMKNKHCYYETMQVLTSTGWEYWRDLPPIAEFLVPNPVTKTLHKELLEVSSFKISNEKLYGFKSKKMEYLVTSNHKLYIKGKYETTFNKIAANLATNWGNHDNSANYSLYKKEGECCPLLAFVGFFLGDGSFASANTINFHLQKQRKIDYLLNLTKKLNIEVKTRVTDKGIVFYMDTPSWLLTYVKKSTQAKDKYFKYCIASLTELEVRGLWNGLVNSDGSINLAKGRIDFSSKSSNLIKLFETLSTFLGMESHQLQDIYGVSKINATYYPEPLGRRAEYLYTKECSGKVYCTTTSTGLLVVRGSPNSHGYICGNSSPLEMIEAWFELKVPIFIARQIHRHRVFVYNEVSARYSVLPEEWYIPEVVGGKPTNGMKQGQEDNLSSSQQQAFKEDLDYACESNYTLYKEYIAEGVAPEHARLFLHVNHYTHFIMKGNLHNWMNFLSLRLDKHAQIEARHYANAIYDLLKQYLPETMNLFDKHRRLVPQSGKPKEVLVKEIANTKFSELSEDELNSIYAILGK